MDFYGTHTMGSMGSIPLQFGKTHSQQLMFTPNTPTTPNYSALYMDSRASPHLTSFIGNLSQVTPYNGHEIVMMRNGVVVSIQQIGKGTFTIGYLSLSLNNLLLVPNLAKNLVSSTHNLISVGFKPNSFSMKDLTQNTTMLVEGVENRLYQFPKRNWWISLQVQEYSFVIKIYVVVLITNKVVVLFSVISHI